MGSSEQYTFKIENTEFIRYTRSGERPPAHHKLVVDSFSLLTKSLPAHSYFLESTEFSAGDHRWVIQIYPEGNEKDTGNGHMSIYLKLCDRLRRGSFINVIFRALVYDQARDKYVVIQDLREKRFDDANAIWGISKALSQADFTSEGNGFLVHDQCIFGAEVFIINTNAPASARVSHIDSNNKRTHPWRIEKFSELRDNEYSEEFIIEGRTWKLNVCPRGWKAQVGRCLSLYLILTQCDDLTAGNKLFTEFELRIKNQLNGKDHSKISRHPFEKSTKSWGISDFVSITDLHIPSNGLVMADVMNIQVHFNQMFKLKLSN